MRSRRHHTDLQSSLKCPCPSAYYYFRRSVCNGFAIWVNTVEWQALAGRRGNLKDTCELPENRLSASQLGLFRLMPGAVEATAFLSSAPSFHRISSVFSSSCNLLSRPSISISLHSLLVYLSSFSSKFFFLFPFPPILLCAHPVHNRPGNLINSAYRNIACSMRSIIGCNRYRQK